MILRNLYIASGILASAFFNVCSAQNDVQTTLTIPPLFVYPTAPENLTELADRSDYLVEHFWDKFNFKNKHAVDQNALNHAFSVYVTPMQWADKNTSVKSVDKLIDKISKNPTMLLQMTKAAEENIYGNRATMWIDEIYIRFLDALVKNKKIPELYKERYGDQLKKLSASAEGAVAPVFTFINRQGENKTFKPSGNYTLIEFGDPTCYECKMAELKLETNAHIDQFVKNGKLNICFIIPSGYENWQKDTEAYPSDWIVGTSDNVDDIYDIRLSPTIYIIGPDERIVRKNIDIVTAINTLTELCK